MSTVGLSFGSATSGAGFNVSSTVASIIAIQQGIETPWKTQLTSLQSQDTALTKIGSDLSTLSSAVSSLTAADGILAAKEGSSSDTNVVSLSSAGTTAVAGSHTIVVNSLAQTSSNYSDSITNSTDTLSGTLTIQVGASGTANPITLDSTDDTLSTLASKINEGSYGVTASIITDANGSRLSLVSNTSGEAGRLTITSGLTDSTTGTSIGFTSGQSASTLNGSITVDGLPIAVTSNTVTGVIAGVTFQLLAAAPSESVQVQITNNNSTIETAVQTLVTAYNAVIADLKTQEGNDSSGNAEPLYGNPIVSQIQSQLSSALFNGNASGSVNNLTQLGITANQDGTLSFDSSTLDSKLNSNFSDVVGFLQGTGSWGQNLATTLNELGNSETTGAVAEQLSQNSTDETNLNTNISNEDAIISADQTTLTTELNTANQELQAIPTQLSEENELYSAITGYNTNPAG